MSQESVEVVRLFHSTLEGQNIIPIIKAGLARLESDPDPDAVRAWMTEDAAWQHLHPEIEWDVWGFELPPARGPMEFAKWWASWVEVWESYAFRVLEYRDLGEWVMTPVEIRAMGRSGISVELDTFEIWQLRDGKIALVRIRQSERQALKAVGLEE